MMLTTEQQPSEEPATQKVPKFLIGIRLHGKFKSELCDPGALNLRVGQWVVIENAPGKGMGTVASNKILNIKNRPQNSCPAVMRHANDKDFEWLEKKEQFENKAKNNCMEQIKILKLAMNLSRVEHYPESNKTTFYFTAEGRIDFRELVRVLAHKLKNRIEMRQVGVRDEAKAITGHGICGEELCCSRFLSDFTPVTIRMAKDQGLALNPSKISGVCGRLMCCLQYEHDIYKSIVGSLPKVGSQVETPEGNGKIVKVSILEKLITVLLDDESFMTYHLDELVNFTPSEPGQETREESLKS